MWSGSFNGGIHSMKHYVHKVPVYYNVENVFSSHEAMANMMASFPQSLSLHCTVKWFLTSVCFPQLVEAAPTD